MTVQTFRDLLSQRPFRPFRLVMSSGQAYEVCHPEMALLTRSDLLVGVDSDDDGIPAEFKIWAQSRNVPRNRIRSNPLSVPRRAAV